MATILPFQGFRYKKDVVGDFNLVVTQPYDKISPEMQQDYYRRSPYSAARITKNLEKNENPDTDYPDAGATFECWLKKGVLVQDALPGIYAYYQDYEIEDERKQQKGFIALLDLKRSASGILPHERTMAEPKIDRLRLMRRLECNDDLIYMLYTDDRLTVNRILEERISGRPPEIKVKDDYGAIHRLWAITEPKALKKIQDAMIPEELFIADGHHRFETSLNFMKECETRGWKSSGIESFDKRMITCFNSADQEVTILPTHRLVRGLTGFDSAAFLSAAEPYFDVEPLVSAAELWEQMRRSRDWHVYGFYPADLRRFYFLRLKEEGKVDPLMLAHPETYRHLDVSILHTLILERQLGIDEEKLVGQKHVEYFRDRNECIRNIDEGKHQAAFFLNPTTVEQVQRVALLGERMPQKSTDFYPKLLTGLVFMKMKILK
jgi:uncharacterized protein (DUF1015 family)